jgi:hypothetical protein
MMRLSLCRFDEWLDSDRIVVRDEAGLKQMQQLKAKADEESNVQKGKSKRKNVETDDESEDDGDSKKRKVADDDSVRSVAFHSSEFLSFFLCVDDACFQDEENSQQAKMIIPPNLQKMLLLDFENIQEHKVFSFDSCHVPRIIFSFSFFFANRSFSIFRSRLRNASHPFLTTGGKAKAPRSSSCCACNSVRSSILNSMFCVAEVARSPIRH